MSGLVMLSDGGAGHIPYSTIVASQLCGLGIDLVYNGSYLHIYVNCVSFYCAILWSIHEKKKSC